MSRGFSSSAFLAWPACELRQPRGWTNSAQNMWGLKGYRQGTIIWLGPIAQMEKLRLRELKMLDQGHKEDIQQS